MGWFVARSSFVLASAWVSLACVGAPPPPPGDGSGSSTGSTSETTAALPVTTSSSEDTRGTADGTGTSASTGDDTSTSTGTDDTTMGVGPTTSSSSEGGESSSTGSFECETPCGSNQECVGGECVEACGGSWGAGSYGYCLDDFGGFATDAVCGANSECVYWLDAMGDIAEATCSSQGCTTACDCSAPPASGDAVVTCGQLTNPAAENDCYLSCANAEVCPDGMSCNTSGVCVSVVPEVPVHGACNNLAPDCAGDGFCTGIGTGEAICMLPCDDVSDCPPSPPSGNATLGCATVSTFNPGPECYLDCSAGRICPDGMSCQLGYICLWDNL